MTTTEQKPKPIDVLRDYVERSTHWREGGATRHDAKLALGELADDIDWIEHGIAEWRDAALKAAADIKQLRADLAAMTQQKDAAYEERNRVVAALASAFPSGIARTAIEGWSEDWHGCVYVDLPTGQASWHFHDSQAHLFAHLPHYGGTWDGHSTAEKYARLAALAAATRDGTGA